MYNKQVVVSYLKGVSAAYSCFSVVKVVVVVFVVVIAVVIVLVLVLIVVVIVVVNNIN